MYSSFIVLTALVAVVFAGPTGLRSSCASECSAKDRFSYEQGRSYEYQYKAKTEVRTGSLYESSLNSDSPGVEVDAVVRIQPTSPCEHVLILEDVTVAGTEKSQEFADAVTAHPVRFSLQNGRVEDVCSSQEEQIWVTNFKKGILSTFQNSMQSETAAQQLVMETDISGTCGVEYSMTTEGSEVRVTKSRSSEGASGECRRSSNVGAKLSSFGYNLDPLVQGVSPLQDEQRCTQIISENIIKSAECKDTYSYVPFSENNDIRVFTTATTSMTLVGISGRTPIPSEAYIRRSNLNFEEPEDVKEARMDSIREILRELESQSTGDVVGKLVPTKFSELISVLKEASSEQMNEIYQRFQQTRGRKFLIDALPLVGTAASTNVVATLIQDDVMSQKEIDIWLTSLSFLKDTSIDMFEPLLVVLQQNPTQKAFFGISSLVHTYCKTHSECHRETEISDILKHIESKLGVSCRTQNDIEQQEILTALRALGNAGRWVNAETILRRCFTEDNPTEVKVAAIDAWRRTPCSYNRQSLVSTFEDYSQNDEIRIASYMAIMKCPSQELIDTIKDRLVSESVNQVASFVWSHLKNVQESADPNKKYIREMIGDEVLQQKFQPEALKFSSYFESSMHSNTSELGVTSEGSIVFARDSILPRSTNLNLTVNLFGQSVNLFEGGARIEGYEQYIEKFFGKDGYYPDEDLQKLIKSLQESKAEASDEYEAGTSKEPKGSFFMRMLGNELVYKNHVGTQDILEQFGFSNPMDLIVELVKNKKIEFMKSFDIINIQFTVPTISGFPISMNLDGTATVAMNIGGDYKLEDIDRFHIDGKIKPSVAMNLKSTIVVDAHVTRSGVKYTSTLHSATQIEGKATMKGLNFVDFSMKAPQDDVKVYDFSQEFITIQNDREEKQENQLEKETSCRTCDMLGVSYCVEYVKPASQVPQMFKNIPSGSFVIKKVDSHKSYDFRFVLNRKKMSLSMERPGSTRDTLHSVEMSYHRNKYVVDLHTPSFATSVKGHFDIENLNKKVTADFTLGEKIHYYGELSLNQDYSNGWSWNPILIVKNEAGEMASEYSAKLAMDDEKESYTVQAKHQGTFLLPSGEFDFVWKFGKRQRDFSLKLNAFPITRPSEKIIDVDLSGSAKLKKRVVGFEIDGHYQVGAQARQQVKISAGVRKEKREIGVAYAAHVNIPALDLAASSSLEMAPEKYEASMDLKTSQFDLGASAGYENKNVNDESFRKINGHIRSQSMRMNIATVTEVEISKDKKVSASTTLDINEIELAQTTVYDPLTKLSSKVTYNSRRLLDMDISIAKNGKISAEISSDEAKLANVKGYFHNKSADGKLNIDMQLESIEKFFKSSIFADNTRFAFEASLKPDQYSKTKSQGYRIHADATLKRMHFETNIVRDVVVDAEFDQGPETKKAKITARYESYAPVEVLVEFSPRHLKGTYQFEDQNIEVYGKSDQGSFEASAQWSPSKKIAITTSYDFGAEPSISFTVLTPFRGWEKQEARFSYSLSDDQLKGQLNLVWKNDDHITSSFNVLADKQQKKYEIRLNFSSTIKHFERIETILSHEGVPLENSKTIVNVEYGSEIIEGKVVTRESSENEKIIDLMLISPFSRKLEGNLRVLLSGKQARIDFEGSYGPYTMKTNFAGSCAKQSANGKLFLSSSHLPEVDFSGKIGLSDGPYLGAQMDISGSVGDENVSIMGSVTTTSSKDVISYKSSLKTVFSSQRTPFIVNFNIATPKKSDIIEIDFDMSRVPFLSEEPLKLHAQGNFFNLEMRDVQLSAYMSAPQIQASFKLEHRRKGLNFKSAVGYSFNAQRLDMSFSSDLSSETYEGSFKIDVLSSCTYLDGLSFLFRHEVQNRSRAIEVQLKNLQSRHRFVNTFTKMEGNNGWKNVFKYNDIFKIKNQLVISSDSTKLTADVKWKDCTIEASAVTSENGKKELNVSGQHHGVQYFTRLNLKGGFQQGTLSFESLIPIISNENLSGELTYDITENPLKVSGVIRSGEKTYKIKIEAAPQFVRAELNQDYVLTASWDLLENVKKFDYKMVTPQATSSLLVKMRIGSVNDITVGFKYGKIEYDLKGKFESGKYELDVQGPLTRTKVDLTVTEESLKGVVNHDGSVIQINLKGKFRPQTGRVSLVVENSRNEMYSGKMSVIYDMEGSKKQLSLEGKVGSQEYKVSNYLQTSKKNNKPTEFGVSIVTPFKSLNEASIKGSFVLSEQMKTLELVSSFNQQTVATLSVNFADDVTSIEATTPAVEFSAKTDFGNKIMTGTYKRVIVAKARPSTYEFTIDVSNKKISVLGQNLEIRASVSVLKQRLQWSGLYQYYNTEVSLTGGLNVDRRSPALKVKLEKSGVVSSFEVETNISDEKYISASLEHNNKIHSVILSTELSPYNGKAQLKLVMPSQRVKNIAANLEYDLQKPKKVASLHLDFDGKIQNFVIKTLLTERDFSVHMQSPISGFRSVDIEGSIEYAGSVYNAVGRFKSDEHDIQFTAAVRPTVTGYDLEAQLPIGQDKFLVQGRVSKTLLEITIINQNIPETKHFIKAKYLLDPGHAMVEIETSSEEFSIFTTEASYTISDREGQIDFLIQKNDFVFETRGSYFVSKLASTIDFQVQPGDDKTRKIRLHYDLDSLQKDVELSASIFEENYSIRLESVQNADNPLDGMITFASSHPLMKIVSLEYAFDETSDGFKGVTSLRMNEQVHEFQVNILTSVKGLKFDFVTPFEGFEHVKLISELDIEGKHGLLEIDLEDAIFSLEATFTEERMLFNLVTPMEEVNLIRFVLSKVWSQEEKTLQFGIGYNTNVFEIGGQLLTQLEKAGFMVKVVTPYTDESQIRMFYNLEDTEDLIDLKIKFNSVDYVTKFGFMLEDTKASIKAVINLPLESLSHAVFVAAIDFSRESNGLKIYLESSGIVHINIQGTVSESETFFDFGIPSESFGHISTSGKINRRKRSVNFMMMNDQAKGMKVRGNFRSLAVDISTPFDRIKTFHLSISKNPKSGKLTIDYKRNQHYVLFEAIPSSKSLELKLDAALPGWELLAVTGRLDHDTVTNYLLGKLPETEMTVTGKGSIGRRTGSAQIVAKTGLENLGTVTVDFSFKRRRSYTLKASASGNPKLKVLVEFKEGGLIVDVFIPHSQADTVIKGQLSLFKGKLEMSSRFPAIKTYSLNYEAILKKVVDIKMKIVRNDIERFVLELHREEGKGHFLLEVRLGGNHSKLHYHRVGMKTLDASFERNGKMLSIKLKGEGQLLRQGSINYDIINSFREETKEVSGVISIDRTGSPKTISIEVNSKPSGRQYTVNLSYNIDLSNIRKGDFAINVVTAVKKASPVPPIRASWDFDADKNGKLTISYGKVKYDIKGKLSLRDTDVTIDSNRPGYGATRILAWRISRNPPSRDYFFKYGTKNVYTLFELTGVIQDIRNADVKGRFKLRRMKNELGFSAKWSGDKSVGISGDGKFSIGDKEGQFKLHKLKRDPSKRASKFKLTGTSNIPGFTSYSVEGEYDLSVRSVDVTAKWDTDSFALKTKLDNFSTKKSENKISLVIPKVGPVEVVISHDFTKPLERTIQMSGNIAGKPFLYKEHWTRNADLTVLDYQADIQSNFLGTIKITASYDVTDINNAKGEMAYTRDGKNNVNVNWHRTSTDTRLENEFVLTSKSSMVPNVKAYAIGDYSSGVKLRSGIEWGSKKIEAKLTVGPKKAEASLTTPFKNFGSASAVATYKITPKKKEIKFNYERMERKIDLAIDLKTPSKKDGSLKISLTSPFEFAKTLTVDAKWNKGDFEAKYTRNEITVDFKGKANVKQGNSSFDVEFTLPSGKPVSLKLAYNLPDFIKGTSKKVEKVLSLDLSVADKHVVLNMKGYRTLEKVIVDLSGSSNLGRIRDFHIKMDSELNLSNREGMLDVKVNDFTFDMKNKFQKLDNGYYFKSQMHSSATKLPGLTVGFGREGDIRTVTLGYGDEREVTISINGKASFKKGFYGKIDIPRRGILGLEYDVNYNFKGENRLMVEGELMLNNGKKVKVDIDYQSDNVKGRLTSPWTGLIRARRSISENEMELAMEDSYFTINSQKAQDMLKKGIKVSGMILGKRVGIDAVADIDIRGDSKVTFAIETPFENYERVGASVLMTRSDDKRTIKAQMDFVAHVLALIELDTRGAVQGRITIEPTPSTPEYVVEFEGNMRNGRKFFNIQLTGSENISAKVNLKPEESFVNVVFGKYSFHGSHQFKKSVLSVKGTVEYAGSPLHVISALVQSKSAYKTEVSVLVSDYYNFQLKSKATDLCENELEAKLKYGTNKHVFVFSGTPITGGTQIKGRLRSDLLPFNKIDFTSVITKEEQLKIFFQAVVNEVVHKIQIEADNKPIYLLVDVVSPLLQSGSSKAEVRVRGRSLLNMKAKFSLEDSNFNYVAKINTDMDSEAQKTIEVDFRSPIEQLKKVKFGAGYKVSDVHEIFMYAQPIDFRTSALFGVHNQIYRAGFEINPGKTGLPVKPISAEAIVPINKVAPKLALTVDGNTYDVSGRVNMSRQEQQLAAIFSENGYKRGFDFAYKGQQSPYEIEYEVFHQTPGALQRSLRKIHLMFDSSLDFRRMIPSHFLHISA